MKNKQMFFYILLSLFFFYPLYSSYDDVFEKNKAFLDKLIEDSREKKNSEDFESHVEGYRILYKISVLDQLALPITTFFYEWISSEFEAFIKDEFGSIDQEKRDLLNKEFYTCIENQGKTILVNPEIIQYLQEKKELCFYRLILLEQSNLPLTNFFYNWIGKQHQIFINEELQKPRAYQKIEALCRNFKSFRTILAQDENIMAASEKRKTISIEPAFMEFLEKQKNMSMQTAFVAPAGVINNKGTSLFEDFHARLKATLKDKYSIELSIIAFNTAMQQAEFRGIFFQEASVYKNYIITYEKLAFLSEYLSKNPLHCSRITGLPITVYLPNEKTQYVIHQAAIEEKLSVKNICSIDIKNPESCKEAYDSINNATFITACMQQYGYLQVYNGLRNMYEIQKNMLKLQKEAEYEALKKAFISETKKRKEIECQKALESLFQESKTPKKPSKKHKPQPKPSSTNIEKSKIATTSTKEQKTVTPILPQATIKSACTTSSNQQERSLKAIEHELYTSQQEAIEDTKQTISKKALKRNLKNLIAQEEQDRNKLLHETHYNAQLLKGITEQLKVLDQEYKQEKQERRLLVQHEQSAMRTLLKVLSKKSKKPCAKKTIHNPVTMIHQQDDVISATSVSSVQPITIKHTHPKALLGLIVNQQKVNGYTHNPYSNPIDEDTASLISPISSSTTTSASSNASQQKRHSGYRHNPYAAKVIEFLNNTVENKTLPSYQETLETSSMLPNASNEYQSQIDSLYHQAEDLRFYANLYYSTDPELAERIYQKGRWYYNEMRQLQQRTSRHTYTQERVMTDID